METINLVSPKVVLKMTFVIDRVAAEWQLGRPCTPFVKIGNEGVLRQIKLANVAMFNFRIRLN